LLTPSTHQHWLRGRIACNNAPEWRKETDPGTRYISIGPSATVLSVGYAHGRVPVLSACLARGDPELLLGREPPVLNVIILALG
jgi:hypothetical protein